MMHDAAAVRSPDSPRKMLWRVMSMIFTEISLLQNAAESQISPLHLVAESRISPQKNAARRFDSPLQNVMGLGAPPGP
jgi:hypothetical protein